MEGHCAKNWKRIAFTSVLYTFVSISCFVLFQQGDLEDLQASGIFWGTTAKGNLDLQKKFCIFDRTVTSNDVIMRI